MLCARLFNIRKTGLQKKCIYRDLLFFYLLGIMGVYLIKQGSEFLLAHDPVGEERDKLLPGDLPIIWNKNRIQYNSDSKTRCIKWTSINSTCVISSLNPMFDHLLKSSLWDDYNKWSNIGFGEEIGIIEITRIGSQYVTNAPK